MQSIVVLPALLLLAFACSAAVIGALWPYLSLPEGNTIEVTKQRAKSQRWAFAFVTVMENSCGRAHARLEPSWQRPGGRGTPGARRRRPRRVRSG